MGRVYPARGRVLAMQLKTFGVFTDLRDLYQLCYRHYLNVLLLCHRGSLNFGKIA